MNLDELLKVNSVRCIKTKVHEDLVEGEIYKVEGFYDETAFGEPEPRCNSVYDYYGVGRNW